MSRKAKIDFYKIEMPEETTVSFEKLLEQTNQLPPDQRVKEVRYVPVWLNRASTWQGVWECDMIRLRMTGVPLKGNLEAKLEDIGLKDDEGIGEEAAFLYDPKTQVLVFQRTQSGVSISGLLNYFQLIGNLSDSIFADPVLQPNAMRQLERMQIIRKFEFRVARLDNMQIFQGEDYAFDQAIKMTEAFHAPSVEVKLSVGKRRKDTLSWESVKNSAASMLRLARQKGQEVSVIRISGTTDEDQTVSVNLLRDAMRENISLNSSKERTIPYAIRQEAIRKAWMRRKDELVSMYPPSSSN